MFVYTSTKFGKILQKTKNKTEPTPEVVAEQTNHIQVGSAIQSQHPHPPAEEKTFIQTTLCKPISLNLKISETNLTKCHSNSLRNANTWGDSTWKNNLSYSTHKNLRNNINIIFPLTSDLQLFAPLCPPLAQFFDQFLWIITFLTPLFHDFLDHPLIQLSDGSHFRAGFGSLSSVVCWGCRYHSNCFYFISLSTVSICFYFLDNTNRKIDICILMMRDGFRNK